ncbi:MAG: 4-hydroxy-3-methylbut-2-enyl diphosphate reductase [Candidatus Marinimicrobia bacterium]|nr:4-hydroxy-3-methylbut-2-enyl diphosphate reductase [Candidatus Neomarinimicrobiota bacterium]
MVRKITIAKDVGFCSGVKGAIQKAREAASRYNKVVMLGDIVHNEKVVKELEKSGVVVIDNIDKIDESTPILFRSHGTKVEIWEKARQKGLTIIDATCPLVLEIHKSAKMLEKEGRKVIIIGDHGHDEVEAIASQVKGPIVISNPREAKELKNIKKSGVVVQSTQLIDDVSEIISILSYKMEDLRFVNTICAPTRKRQEQVKELARAHDVMIIVGSFTSANTKRLTQIAKRINIQTYQIQGVEDIEPMWFNSAYSVGISAGASTPDFIVDEVAKKIVAIPC